jgi:Carboxypeptidase regulatory-like domain
MSTGVEAQAARIPPSSTWLEQPNEAPTVNRVTAQLRTRPCVLLLALWSCSLPWVRSQAAVRQGGCVVEGKVTDAIDGRPLAGAEVSLAYTGPAWRPPSTVTSADGRFALANLRPGRYYIEASRSGYTSRSYGQRSFRGAGALVSVSPGQRLRNVVISLNPAAAVAGRITDERGKALDSVVVQALREAYWDGRLEWNSMGSIKADQQGRYRLPDLPLGRYYISAQDMTDGESAAEKTHVPFYYPGVLDPADAAIIDLNSGAETQADIALPTVRVVTVRGQVVSALTGKPALKAGLLVFGHRRSLSFYAGTVSMGARGTFTVRGLVPGTYTLFAKEPTDPSRDHWISGWRQLEAEDTNLENVSIAVSPGARVTGRVRVEDGRKIDYTSLSVMLDPREDVMDTEEADPVERVNRDGTVLFRDVLPGTYDVRLSDPAGTFYLKSAIQGSEDLLVKGLWVNPPEASAPLDLIVRAGAGRIEGVVLDHGQPAMNATVVLVPDMNHGSPEQFVTTASADEHGHFELVGLTPGDYEIFAWGDVERIGYRSPDVLRSYENSGVVLHVAPNSRLKLSLQMIPD